MRHLVSIVAAPIIGLVIYLLLGFSLTRVRFGIDDFSSSSYVAVAAALVCGVLYALLLLPRWSPLGPALVGAAYLSAAGWALADPSSFVDVVPRDPLGLDNAGVAPAGPVIMMLGLPLLATVLGARRWRRHPAAAGVPAPPPGYQQPPASTQPLPGYPTQPGYPGPPPPAYGGPTDTPPYGYPPPAGGHAYGAPAYPPDPLDPERTQRI